MDLDGVYRAEYGRCVATLTRILGDIGLAEEAVQDAFAVAVQKWGETLPPNPGAWIVTTARNRAIDRLRRESTRQARHAQALLLHHPGEPAEVGPVRALATIEDLDLPGYHLLPATRADLLTRLGRTADAVAAYDEAIALATNDTERAFLETRRARLTQDA